MMHTQSGYGGPPGGGGYGPPGGGGYGGPPGGGGYGPPGGGGYGGPPGGGGYGPPPGGGGFGGPPGGYPPGGGGFGSPPGGGFGGPPGGGFGGPPPGYPPGFVGSGGGPGGGFGGGPRTETLAIISLVVGILSVPMSFCCSFFGIPLSITAVIMGVIAIGNINKDPQQLDGKGLAIGGIATGAFGLVMLVLLLVFGMAGALLGKL